MLSNVVQSVLQACHLSQTCSEHLQFYPWTAGQRDRINMFHEKKQEKYKTCSRCHAWSLLLYCCGIICECISTVAVTSLPVHGLRGMCIFLSFYCNLGPSVGTAKARSTIREACMSSVTITHRYTPIRHPQGAQLGALACMLPAQP